MWTCPRCGAIVDRVLVELPVIELYEAVMAQDDDGNPRLQTIGAEVEHQRWASFVYCPKCRGAAIASEVEKSGARVVRFAQGECHALPDCSGMMLRAQSIAGPFAEAQVIGLTEDGQVMVELHPDMLATLEVDGKRAMEQVLSVARQCGVLVELEPA